MPLPTGLAAGAAGHVSWHNDIHDRLNKAEMGKVYNVRHYGAVGDGVANDTAAIAAAVAAAPAGSIVYFPLGVYKTDAVVTTKMLHFRGDGRYSSWLVPNSANTTGLVQFSVPVPTSTVRAVYGPSFGGLGIDLTGFGTTVGLYVGATTGWFTAHDVFMAGGAAHVHNLGTNSRFEQMRLVDAGIFFRVNGDTGLELTLADIDATRATAGTTTWGIECISTLTSGNGGDIRLDNVVFNSAVGGGAVLAGGILWQAGGTAVSIPIFGNDVVIDNCAGPAVKLVNVKDIKFGESWFNSAAGATAAVQITAGGNIKFTDSDFFGGTGSAGTFEFLGSVPTAGFISKDNYCPSGPVYRFTGAGGVTDMFTDDWVLGATAVSQITNDEPKFLAAAGRRWGRLWLQQVPITPAEAVHIIGAGGEPAFQNSWVNQAGATAFFWRDPAGTVHLTGSIQGGADATVAFTLPAGWRPFAAETFSVPNGLCVVTSAGAVTLHTGGAATSLSGISFRALN